MKTNFKIQTNLFFLFYPLYSINLYITMAISIATRAKYHEAINIIEIQRKTPMRDKNLKLKFNFLFREQKANVVFFYQ